MRFGTAGGPVSRRGSWSSGRQILFGEDALILEGGELLELLDARRGSHGGRRGGRLRLGAGGGAASSCGWSNRAAAWATRPLTAVAVADHRGASDGAADRSSNHGVRSPLSDREFSGRTEVGHGRLDQLVGDSRSFDNHAVGVANGLGELGGPGVLPHDQAPRNWARGRRRRRRCPRH